MEAWRMVWRNGIAPQLAKQSLLDLETALKTDDYTLTQGVTVVPPSDSGPVQCVGACAIAYPAWRTEKLRLVYDVETRFYEYCKEIDRRMGEPAACKHFLEWFDETPREEMRRELLIEVQRSLAQLVA